MPRIRTIKPEFWDSPSVAKASPWARLLFIAMWNWADDHGRGTANLKELEGFAFPFDDQFTDSSGNTVHFRDLVAEVSECFNVQFYMVGKRHFYAIPTWDQHQRNERRSKQSKHPDPPVITRENEGVAEIPCNVAEIPRTSPLGTGEQGNRGTELIAHPADTRRIDFENLFNTFWQAWPIKKGKEPARKAFIKAMKSGTSLDTIMAGVEAYKRELGPISAGKTLDGRAPKWAQGWLNDQRWTDEPDTSNHSPSAAASIGRPTAAEQCALGVHGKRTATNECVICGERLETNPF